MTYKIEKINKTEYPEVIQVWEASVRATHSFLQEEDILYYKPLILKHYLDAVELRSIRDEEGKIICFSGVADGNIEMLFIHPDHRGKGIGKALLNYCIETLNCHKVDVNEQNEQAVGFYKKQNFIVIDRSELDSSGKAYPILQMELQK